MENSFNIWTDLCNAYMIYTRLTTNIFFTFNHPTGFVLFPFLTSESSSAAFVSIS